MSLSKKVKYIYDKNGKKKNVVIPFNKYLSLMEDLSDLKSVKYRRKEKSIPLELVKKRLSKPC